MIQLIGTACSRFYECLEFGEKFLKTVQSFNVDIRACVRMGMGVSE